MCTGLFARSRGRLYLTADAQFTYYRVMRVMQILIGIIYMPRHLRAARYLPSSEDALRQWQRAIETPLVPDGIK